MRVSVGGQHLSFGELRVSARRRHEPRAGGGGVHGGGGGTRCWSSRGGGGDSSEPEGSPGRVAWFALRVAAGAACALAAAASLPAYDTRPFSAAFTHDTTALPVCVVIPALNEQAVLESTLRCVAALRPPPAAVVVAVGPSTDRTARLARAYGATVVTGGRGRSVQMNAGASAALSSVRPATPAGSAERAPPPPAALLFVHADTRLPPDAVALVRGALAQPRVVAGGFVSLLESPHCTWWAQSFHNTIKTFYLPALFRPLSAAHGLRILFGDQCIFCRSDVFQSVGGFDERVPIMEDADLCLKVHAQGPPGTRATVRDVTPGRSRRARLPRACPRGRVVLLNRCIASDGRRFAVWGNGSATVRHVVISLSWYYGASDAQMRRLYARLYGDIRETAK